MKAIFICVNYFNDDETLLFINELLSQNKSKHINILLVDNSMRSDKSVQISLLETYSSVKVLYPKQNLGYFGGASYALNFYISKNPLPEWIILSNTDICFTGKNFIQDLFMYYPDGYNGILAPSIYSSLSKTDQNPYLKARPRRFKSKMRNVFFQYYVIYVCYQFFYQIKMIIKGIYSDKICSRKEEMCSNGEIIYAPHGSFMIFNSAYFKKGGDFNYPIFLFGEELYVAEVALHLGLNVKYEPRLKVLHNEHSSNSIYKSKKMLSYIKDANNYYLKTLIE